MIHLPLRLVHLSRAEYRKAELLGNLNRFIFACNQTRARYYRNPSSCGQLSSSMFQSESLNALGRRSCKDQTCTCNRPSKIGILGKKAVARNDGIGSMAFGYFDDLIPLAKSEQMLYDTGTELPLTHRDTLLRGCQSVTQLHLRGERESRQRQVRCILQPFGCSIF